MDQKLLENNKILTLDQAIEMAGDSNLYQKRTTMFLGIQSLIISFILQGQFSCKEEQACQSNNFIIDPNSQESLVKSFNLYCDNKYLINLTQSLFFLFSNIFTLIFSYIADYKGRKITIFYCYILGAISALFASFAQDWTTFMIALIITGCGLSPYITVTFVLLNEISGQKFRAQSSLSLSISWGIGQVVFILIASYYKTWQTQMLYFIAIPLVSQMVTFFWIYESPKFLIMKKEYKKAQSIFQKIAKVNKRNLSIFQFQEEHVETESLNKTLEQAKTYGYMDVFKYKSLRYITIIMMMTQFTIYITYYGLIFNLNQLNSDIFTTALLCSSAEIIAYLVTLPLLKLRRRIVFPSFLFIAGFISTLYLITEEDFYSMCFAIAVKFFISVAFSIMFIYTVELYPIVVKSLGNGFTNFFGKFGCAFAPAINYIAQNMGTNPMVIYGFMCMINAIFLLKLPETLDQQGQMEIQELQQNNNYKHETSIVFQKQQENSQKISTDVTNPNEQITTNIVDDCLKQEK